MTNPAFEKPNSSPYLPPVPEPPSNWTTYAESAFPHEADALRFVRELLPTHSPWHAWSNFEFLSPDGSLYEVDLMVLLAAGLVPRRDQELERRAHRQRPHRLAAAGGRRRVAADAQPAQPAQRQGEEAQEPARTPADARFGPLPFLDVLVFLAEPPEAFDNQLKGAAASHVVTRATLGQALRNREAPGLRPVYDTGCDAKALRTVTALLKKAGVRESNRHRRIGDYKLGPLLREGPGWQDFAVEHAEVKTDRPRLARVYNTRQEADPAAAARLDRAARREYRLLQTLQHPAIQKTYDFSTQGELGPALFLEHRPGAEPFTRWRADADAAGTLTDDARIGLLRRLAEAVDHAHRQGVHHRLLSGASVLIEPGPPGTTPAALIRDWQAGTRRSVAEGRSTPAGTSLAATAHAPGLADALGLAYLAPELAHHAAPPTEESPGAGVAADVFSLGALAYELFAGQPPAASHEELIARLRGSGGLSVAAARDGTPDSVEDLVATATHPLPRERHQSVRDFLAGLDLVEEQFTRGDNLHTGPPPACPPGSFIADGVRVLERLGSGSNAVAFLVERNKKKLVLKVAHEADEKSSQRIDAEADALDALRHPLFVKLHGRLDLRGHRALLVGRAGGPEGRTLLQALDDNRSPDVLHRLGADLAEALGVLEDRGIAHRDLKPENIGTGSGGGRKRTQLVLYDFSLSREDPRNLRAGTPGFLDPFLCEREEKKWDLHAERYAAAVTLYQLATKGHLPVWGDGHGLPEMLPPAVDTPTLSPDRLDAAVRGRLTAFFLRALARRPADRHENAAAFARAWDDAFAGTATDHADDAVLGAATRATPATELNLGPSADDVFLREKIATVDDLLNVSGFQLRRWKGVTAGTRDAILAARARLRTTLPPETITDEAEPAPGADDSAPALAEHLLALAIGSPRGRGYATADKAMRALLTRKDGVETGQVEAAAAAGVSRARVSQLLTAAIEKKWAKDPRAQALREEVADLLVARGGVATLGEVAAALAAAHPSNDEQDPLHAGHTLARIAAEAERAADRPAFSLFRPAVRGPEQSRGMTAVLALDEAPARAAFHLGTLADELIETAGETLPGADAAADALRAGLAREHPGVLEAWSLDDGDRLLRLAAAASAGAALSARRELYPVGMAPERSLRLAAGTLGGGVELPALRKRIHARYPRAAALPDDAGLLALLLGIDPGYHLSDTTRPTGAPPVLRNHHRGPITRARGREVTTTVAEPPSRRDRPREAPAPPRSPRPTRRLLRPHRRPAPPRRRPRPPASAARHPRRPRAGPPRRPRRRRAARLRHPQRPQAPRRRLRRRRWRPRRPPVEPPLRLRRRRRRARRRGRHRGGDFRGRPPRPRPPRPLARPLRPGLRRRPLARARALPRVARVVAAVATARRRPLARPRRRGARRHPRRARDARGGVGLRRDGLRPPFTLPLPMPAAPPTATAPCPTRARTVVEDGHPRPHAFLPRLPRRRDLHRPRVVAPLYASRN